MFRVKLWPLGVEQRCNECSPEWHHSFFWIWRLLATSLNGWSFGFSNSLITTRLWVRVGAEVSATKSVVTPTLWSWFESPICCSERWLQSIRFFSPGLVNLHSRFNLDSYSGLVFAYARIWIWTFCYLGSVVDQVDSGCGWLSLMVQGLKQVAWLGPDFTHINVFERSYLTPVPTAATPGARSGPWPCCAWNLFFTCAGEC